MSAATLCELLDRGLEGPDRISLWTPARSLSSRELWRASTCMAHRFAKQAPEPVALRLLDPAAFVIAALAVWRSGCPLLPLDGSLPVQELASAVAETGARTLVCDQVVPGLAEAIAPLRCSIVPLLEGWEQGPEPSVRADDVALLLYTSGSTGTSKCVVFEHQAIVRNVLALGTAAGFEKSDRFFSPLSPALATTLATCVLPAIGFGGELLLGGRVLPGRILDIMQGHRVTVLAAVPFVYHLLAEVPKTRALPDLRIAITNSAPLPVPVAEAFEVRTGLLPRSNYCSSEAGGITYNQSLDRGRLLSSVGTPLPGVHVRVVGEDSRDLPDGVEGEIIVQTPMGARGYLRRPELQKAVFRDGWIWTGDRGMRSSDSFLRITGRATETLNVAGHLVNPIEVEQVLNRHPRLKESLVFGEIDGEAGEVLVALVVSDEEVEPQELKAYLGQHVAPFKVPRRIRRVDALPRTALGKLRRRDGAAL